MKFDKINEMNEAIKAINDTSFQIRICALNSQISISNISHTNNKSSGFAAISAELIRISNLLEKGTNELFQILHESMQLSTKERKIIRSQNLQKKFIHIYRSVDPQKKIDFQKLETRVLKKYDLGLVDINKKLNKHFDSLKLIAIEMIKLCKFSKPIVYSVKIESSFVGERLDIFNQLAEDLSNSISRIESLLKQIQTLNLELQNYEG